MAATYDRRFEALYDRLSPYPARGALRPGLGAGIRIAIVVPFVAIYAHDEDADLFTILRILHGRQDVTRRLLAST